jgi:hypothetical protein
MADSVGFSAQGTILLLGDGGSPEVFTEVGEITGIDGPSIETDDLDFTRLNAPLGFKEYKPGLVEPGELTCSINSAPAEPTLNWTTGIISLQASKAIRNWRYQFPDLNQTTMEFKGYVKGFTFDAQADGKHEGEFTVKRTGPTTWIP